MGSHIYYISYINLKSCKSQQINIVQVFKDSIFKSFLSQEYKMHYKYNILILINYILYVKENKKSLFSTLYVNCHLVNG